MTKPFNTRNDPRRIRRAMRRILRDAEASRALWGSGSARNVVAPGATTGEAFYRIRRKDSITYRKAKS